MAKRPLAGWTKTRLSPPLTAHQAAALYRCFLADTLDVVRAVTASLPGVKGCIAHTPADAGPFFRRFAPDFDLVPQLGEDLGERLDAVLSQCLGAGIDQVVAINSDSPTLPASHIIAAFRRLDREDTDVVFGPCEDGGYYLIGLTQAQPRLVRDVQMSTPHVLHDTLCIAREEGLRTALLPAWYDVDTVEQLARLRRELDAGGAEQAPHTSRYLSDLDGAMWHQTTTAGID